ncbi:hypothetical protein RJ640_003116 [Escallonia rubra]|uniref:DUF4283 domain-containing protein n=1 Tax=Escallonia rubra TaxID=112253 RepID=A0AA88QSH9_9ASTE|nr:hypothetical protein RJ640_003116 [Escallonia rubra]
MFHGGMKSVSEQSSRKIFCVERKTFDVELEDASNGSFLKVTERGKGYVKAIFLEKEAVAWARQVLDIFLKSNSIKQRTWSWVGNFRSLRLSIGINRYGEFLRLVDAPLRGKEAMLIDSSSLRSSHPRITQVSYRDVAALPTFPMYGKASLSGNVVTVDTQSTKARTYFLQSCLVGCFSFKDIDCAELKRWASVAWEIRAEFHIFPLSPGRVIFQLPSALEAERILRRHEKSWKGTPFILDRWDMLSDYGGQYLAPFQTIISVKGIPMHLRCEDLFLHIGNLCGEFCEVLKSSNPFYDEIKLKVRVFNALPEYIIIKDNSRSIRVNIVEEIRPSVSPDFLSKIPAGGGNMNSHHSNHLVDGWRLSSGKVVSRPKIFKANSTGINPTNEELHGYSKHQGGFNHIRKGLRFKQVWVPKVKSDGPAQCGPDKVISDCSVALAPCFVRPKPNFLEIHFNTQKQQFLVGLGCIKLCISLPDLFGFRRPWFMGKAKDALQTFSFGKAVPVFQPFSSSFHSSAPMLCDSNSVTEVNSSSSHDSIIPCAGNIQNCFDSSCLVVELQLSDNDDHADSYSPPSQAPTPIPSENNWFAEDDLWISTHSILDGNKLGLSFTDSIQEEQQIFQRVEEERILAREESRRLKIARELKKLECSVIYEAGETSTVRKRRGDLSSNN